MNLSDLTSTGAPRAGHSRRTLGALALLLATAACTEPAEMPGSGGGSPMVTARAVTGVVVDTHGAPISNARVWIEPAVTTGLVETTTDDEGIYVVENLVDVPYLSKAWNRVEFGGDTFCLRLGMSRPADFAAFTVEAGAVRNFRWQLSGPIEDLRDYDAYFGGEVRLFVDGDMKAGNVELTFTPTSPLVDGSRGETIVRTFNLFAEELMVYDLPLANYTVSGVLLEGGARTPLHVGLGSSASGYEGQTPTAALTWKPSGCGNASGIDRAFLYLASPYAL